MDQDRVFKNAVYEQVARLGQALAHPRRLELLDLLCQGPMTVEVLARKSAMSMANCSQHLQHLKAANLVRSEAQGSARVYHLKDASTCALVRLVGEVAERYYAELRDIYQEFMKGTEGFEAVTVASLQERMDRDSVLLIDVRPAEEYASGHLPSAISLPYESLAERLSDLPKDRTVVAYCRGPFCVLSLHAVETLRAAGFDALRLKEGVVNWRGARELVTN